MQSLSEKLLRIVQQLTSATRGASEHQGSLCSPDAGKARNPCVSEPIWEIYLTILMTEPKEEVRWKLQVGLLAAKLP